MADQTPFRLTTAFVDPSSRSITNGSFEITLSPRAIGVLNRLRIAGTRPVSRDALMDAVWPDVVVTDESLTQAVSEIRTAFCDLGLDREIITTIHRTGYRLRADPVDCEPTLGEGADPELGITIDAYCMVQEAQSALVRAEEFALEKAVELSRAAVGLSPDSALAHATYSVMLVHQALYSAAGYDNIQIAVEHAQTAVSIAPQASLAQAALGFALGAPSGEASAFNALTRGVTLNDHSGEAHYLAARVAIVSRDFRTAATLAMRSAERVSDPARPLFLAARAAQHFDQSLSTKIANRCVRMLENGLDIDPDDSRSRHTLGPALCLAGDTERAWKIIDDQRRNRSICSIHDFFGFACLRDEKRALEALENALDDGFRHADWLRHEPMLATIQKNQKFEKYLSSASN